MQHRFWQHLKNTKIGSVAAKIVRRLTRTLTPRELRRDLARLLTPGGAPKIRRSGSSVIGHPRLLIVGVYLANEPNCASRLIDEFSNAKRVEVEQRWACLKGAPPDESVATVTKIAIDDYKPKWQLVNELIDSQDLRRFDYFAICDDDIFVGRGFIDCFIAEQQSLDFALAQPARTWRSFADHTIVYRRLFARARQTSFVECGPLVCFRRDMFEMIYPFSLESPMGWGYDLTWPIIARDHKLKIGIIDGVPVDHTLRERAALYDGKKQLAVMARYLSTRRHVHPNEIIKPLRIHR